MNNDNLEIMNTHDFLLLSRALREKVKTKKRTEKF